MQSAVRYAITLISCVDQFNILPRIQRFSLAGTNKYEVILCKAQNSKKILLK